jgi:hypothetical protein
MNIRSVVLLSVLALVVGTSRAHGATIGPDYGTPSVIYSHSSLVQGSSAAVTALDLTGAGELFVTLTDLDFPEAVSSLDFSLSSSGTDLVGLADPGTLRLSVTGPVTLYADVFATAQADTGVGLYNLTATFLPTATVPLPPAGLLLASALWLPLWALRRRSRLPLLRLASVA